MEDHCPPLVYERAPCPRCGATTTEQAETACQPSCDETGEYYCPASADDAEDADGYIQQPTEASIAAQDAWFAARDPSIFGDLPPAETGGRNG